MQVEWLGATLFLYTSQSHLPHTTDVDAKVEALSKLQAHFGKGVIEVYRHMATSVPIYSFKKGPRLGDLD